MRILYVINGFDPGGAEHGLLTLLRAGFFDGHELKILAICRGRGSLAGDVAAEAGATNMLLVSQSEKLKLGAFISAFFQTLHVFRHWAPDVAVLSLKQANIVGRIAAMLCPRLRCISFEHTGKYRANRAQFVYGPVLRALSWRVDEVWADCKQTLCETGKYFSSRNRRGHVVPLFVADGKAPCKLGYDLHTPIRIVAAGRLTALKNFALVIETLAALQGRDLKAELEIFGDGPERDSLVERAATLGLSRWVRFAGYRPRWYEGATTADVFLNLSEMEGFCIVVAEAMLVGLPVVTTDTGGIRDYGVDGENMLKVASPSVDQAADRIVRLAQDKTLRRQIGQNARADVLRRYTSENLRHRAVAILGG